MAEVKLTVTGDGSQGVQALRNVNNEVGHLESRMRSLAGVITGVLTTAILGISIATVFNKGVEAVDNFQQSVIQTAAVITSLQGGDKIAENYRKAKEYSEGLQLTLQQVDARTVLNLANLQMMTEEMVKQGVVLDNNNANQVEAFTRLANAVAVYSRNGASEIQVRQEIRALMMGEVDQNSQLAQMVQRTVDGPLKQKVEQWKQSGTLVEELGKRLSGFGEASKDLNMTWGAVKSSMQTSVDLVLRAGFGVIVKDLVEWLNRANEYLKTHREEIGTKIKSAWETVKTVMGTVADTAKTIWDNFEPFVTVLVGGAIIKGVTGIIEIFTTLYRTLLMVQGAMVAVGALSGTATAATAAGAAGAVGVGGGVLAAIGGGLAGTAAGIGGGIALGFGLQPAVRWLDKKLYNGLGWNLTGEAMYNEAQGRDQEAQARWQFFQTENAKYVPRNGAAGAPVPKVDLGDTPEQIKEKIKLQEKELAVYKVNQESMAALAKARAEIELATMKGRYDEGLVSTRSYFEAEKRIALEVAQQKFDSAAAYLKKEEGLLAFIKAKKGEKSPEYQEELSKNQKAIEEMKLAQLDLSKVTVETDNKMTAALREREQEYAKLKATALESASKYVEAEKVKQDAEIKTVEYLRLQKEAAEGVAGAIAALAAVETRRAADMVAAQNKVNEEARNYAKDIASLRDELGKLRGEDQRIIDAEAKLREALDKTGQLQDRIKLAWAQGNVAAINALSQQIQLQEQLNSRLRDNAKLQQDAAVLSGAIVGFNNGVPIYRNGGGAFSNGQAVNPYISPTSLLNSGGPSNNPTDAWGNSPGSPYYMSGNYSTGIAFGGGRATGGPVNPHTLYIINENGSEMLLMGNRGGQIVPANKTAAKASSSDSYHFSGDIILPNVTNQTTARELFAEFQKLARRKAA